MLAVSYKLLNGENISMEGENPKSVFSAIVKHIGCSTLRELLSLNLKGIAEVPFDESAKWTKTDYLPLDEVVK